MAAEVIFFLVSFKSKYKSKIIAYEETKAPSRTVYMHCCSIREGFLGVPTSKAVS